MMRPYRAARADAGGRQLRRDATLEAAAAEPGVAVGDDLHHMNFDTIFGCRPSATMPNVPFLAR